MKTAKKQLHSIAVAGEILRDFVGFYLGKWVTIRLDKYASGSFCLKDNWVGGVVFLEKIR